MPSLSDLDRLAMEYVLGIASAEDQQLAEQRLATDPAFRDLTEAWREPLAVVAELTPARQPPPRMLQAIKRRIAVIEAARAVIDDGQGWQEIVPGVSRKELAPLQADGQGAMLLRFAAGAALPGHPHHGDEVCVVLDGAVLSNGVTLGAGDCQSLRAGTRHRPVRSPGGALVYVQVFAPLP